MAGFPNRIIRSSLGPEMVDEWPVDDPTKYIPAAGFNLAWWQLAGCNLVVPRAVLVVAVAGAAAETNYQALAFDPEGAQPFLEWAYDAVGQFSFEFPLSEYPDQDGNEITLALVGGDAAALSRSGSNNVVGNVVLTGPKSGTVYLETTGGTMADVNFLMRLY